MNDITERTCIIATALCSCDFLLLFDCNILKDTNHFFSWLRLQGYNKDTAYRDLGLDQELVMQMRRSYDVRPPRMDDDHPYWHGNDRRYKKLSQEQMERTRAESLKDTADRIMPFYDSLIGPALRAGNKCLVVSHANTIRTLIKNIDSISDEDIKQMSIPVSI
jgi:2,3-bisphosphoglycerate-dependent phosphoglycerate mutase